MISMDMCTTWFRAACDESSIRRSEECGRWEGGGWSHYHTSTYSTYSNYSTQVVNLFIVRHIRYKTDNKDNWTFTRYKDDAATIRQ